MRVREKRVWAEGQVSEIDLGLESPEGNAPPGEGNVQSASKNVQGKYRLADACL